MPKMKIVIFVARKVIFQRKRNCFETGIEESDILHCSRCTHVLFIKTKSYTREAVFVFYAPEQTDHNFHSAVVCVEQKKKEISLVLWSLLT